MNNELFQKNHMWNYTVRVVDPLSFTIKFVTKGDFRTKEEAEIAQKKDDDFYNKEMKRIKSLTNIKYTFTEFLEYWFDNIYNTSSANTSTKTVALYSIQKLIIPNVEADVMLPYVTSEFLNEIIRKCLLISSSSGYSCRKFLSLILKDANIYGYLKKDLSKELQSVPEPRTQMALPDRSVLKKLLEEAVNHPTYYLEILLALFCGLRQGEILGLKYSDFDEKNQTLRIERQWTRSYTIVKKSGEYKTKRSMEMRSPKCDSVRILKIPGFIFEELKRKKKHNAELITRAKNRNQKTAPKEYICVSFYGKRKTSSCLTPALKKICSNAGISPLRMHMLRHCFATIMLESGESIEAVSHCLGHKSPQITFNTYCGVCLGMDQARDILNKSCPAVSEPECDQGVLLYV